ncbi:MAG: DCC1-like thiol-disulfide oxidoreductase family protein [Bacteroidales bacterium]|nr:DCC1-like thiol-disulfide oxidoreductase family protein [Bacteroidales bacterium]
MTELVKPTLIYDGYCNLCSWLVRFTQRHDKQGRINLLPLQDLHDTPFADILGDLPLRTVVFVNTQGEVSVKSRAVLGILKLLGGGWVVLWSVIVIIPNPIRDFFYNLISRNRYKWFGKRQTCYYPLPTKKES